MRRAFRVCSPCGALHSSCDLVRAVLQDAPLVHTCVCVCVRTLSSPAAMARILSEKIIVSSLCAMVMVVRPCNTHTHTDTRVSLMHTVRSARTTAGIAVHTGCQRCRGLGKGRLYVCVCVYTRTLKTLRIVFWMSESVCRSMAAVASSSTSTRVFLITQRAMQTCTHTQHTHTRALQLCTHRTQHTFA